MLEAFLPKAAKRVVVYLHPVNVRLGLQKLAALCRDVVGVEPDDNTCFLFVNRRHDILLMYFAGRDGEQTMTKKLQQGSFLLPAPGPDGAPFVILKASMLPRLFRT